MEGRKVNHSKPTRRVNVGKLEVKVSVENHYRCREIGVPTRNPVCNENGKEIGYTFNLIVEFPLCVTVPPPPYPIQINFDDSPDESKCVTVFVFEAKSLEELKSISFPYTDLADIASNFKIDVTIYKDHECQCHGAKRIFAYTGSLDLHLGYFYKPIKALPINFVQDMDSQAQNLEDMIVSVGDEFGVGDEVRRSMGVERPCPDVRHSVELLIPNGVNCSEMWECITRNCFPGFEPSLLLEREMCLLVGNQMVFLIPNDESTTLRIECFNDVKLILTLKRVITKLLKDNLEITLLTTDGLDFPPDVMRRIEDFRERLMMLGRSGTEEDYEKFHDEWRSLVEKYFPPTSGASTSRDAAIVSSEPEPEKQ